MPDSDARTTIGPADTLKAFFAAYTGGRIDDGFALFTDDAVIKVEGAPHVPFTGEWQGPDKIREFYRVLTSVAKPEVFEIHEFVEDGNTAIALGTFDHVVFSTQRHYRGDFALRVHTVGGRIDHYQIYENSFSISQAFDE